MMIVHAARKLTLALAATGTLFAGMSAMATPALANHISIGIGIGFPVYPAWGYYRPWYRPYPYYAPPVVYAAPPVVYAPPPRIVYYAPPVYAAPVQAVPTSDVYRANNGQYCREYQTTVRVAGHYENSYGTACQEPDGSWHVAN